MLMQVHIYSVKAKSQAGNMSQRYNTTQKKTQKAKAERKSARGLKNYAFCQKIQQRASGPGESAAGVTYVSIRIHPKSCRIFPQKVTAAATLLSGSRAQLEHNHVVKIGAKATC